MTPYLSKPIRSLIEATVDADPDKMRMLVHLAQGIIKAYYDVAPTRPAEAWLRKAEKELGK